MLIFGVKILKKYLRLIVLTTWGKMQEKAQKNFLGLIEQMKF